MRPTRMRGQTVERWFLAGTNTQVESGKRLANRETNRRFGGIPLKHSIVTVFVLCMATALQVYGQANQQTSAIARRPITHADYDGWHTIQSEKLSRDGKVVAYALMPQAGDAELVVRNLKSCAEFRGPVCILLPLAFSRAFDVLNL